MHKWINLCYWGSENSKCGEYLYLPVLMISDTTWDAVMIYLEPTLNPVAVRLQNRIWQTLDEHRDNEWRSCMGFLKGMSLQSMKFPDADKCLFFCKYFCNVLAVWTQVNIRSVMNNKFDGIKCDTGIYIYVQNQHFVWLEKDKICLENMKLANASNFLLKQLVDQLRYRVI